MSTVAFPVAAECVDELIKPPLFYVVKGIIAYIALDVFFVLAHKVQARSGAGGRGFSQRHQRFGAV